MSTPTVKVACWSPSAIESSMPVIVNVCGVAQFNDVNVNPIPAPPPTCASPESLEADQITTGDAGWVSSTTVNVSWPPASVTDTVVVDNVNPTVSSSVVVAVTDWLATSS